MTTQLPDILVAGDGETAAIRGPDGRLTLMASGRDRFALKEWLAVDGDARTVKDASLHEGVRCDAIGCVGRLRDGRPVSFALSAEAFAEDCARGPGACAATLIDRTVWREQGAVALRWIGDCFQQAAAHPAGLDRP